MYVLYEKMKRTVPCKNFCELFYANTPSNITKTIRCTTASLLCPPCCATSCKSRICKTKKTHELGHFFFFPSPTTSGSREAGGKSLIHLGRSESGVNPCENNAEGWIMMIVETTYRTVVRVPRVMWVGGFPDVLHTQA